MAMNQFAKMVIVRSGIWTHAHRSGLRPERSALDHSAILTYWNMPQIFYISICVQAKI